MFKSELPTLPGVVQAAQRIYRENVLDFYIPETIEFPRSFDRRQPILTLPLPSRFWLTIK